MKAHLTKVSLALLSAALVLGCQDLGSGPVGPDGLVPQFKRGGNKPGGDLLVFEVNIVDDITGGPHQSKPSDKGILLKGITLNLSFFDVSNGLTCALGSQTGDLTLHAGDSGSGHAFLLFHFTHDSNGIKHSLEMDAIITDTDTWLTAVANSMTEGPEEGNGHWIVKASGRNHQNGCTGEGGGEVNVNGIDFLATVVPV